jgi:hypothetical protein
VNVEARVEKQLKRKKRVIKPCSLKQNEKERRNTKLLCKHFELVEQNRMSLRGRVEKQLKVIGAENMMGRQRSIIHLFLFGGLKNLSNSTNRCEIW